MLQQGLRQSRFLLSETQRQTEVYNEKRAGCDWRVSAKGRRRCAKQQQSILIDWCEKDTRLSLVDPDLEVGAKSRGGGNL